MQLDMHYYGTYAMARAAGVNEETSKTIATCAQFVDDNKAESSVSFKDGSRIDSEATAHHPIDSANLDEHDQRRVWVPFHFLPGNEGESYTERLKCRKNSPIAQELRDHHLGLADRVFAPELIGITAHVYGDTFSHYGFSGVSSRGNKVINDSFRFHEDVPEIASGVSSLEPRMRDYINKKAKTFFEKGNKEHGGLFKNIVSWVADLGAIGHGSVATYPDRPYLVWAFEYERKDHVADGVSSVRNNPVTFLEGCKELHEMFSRFAATRQDLSSGDSRAFNDIAEKVYDVLSVQGDKSERIDAWQSAADEGIIFGTAGGSIPDYEGEEWNEIWLSLDEAEDMFVALDSPIWRFYQAAALHRTYVLRDLLPRHKLIVD